MFGESPRTQSQSFFETGYAKGVSIGERSRGLKGLTPRRCIPVSSFIQTVTGSSRLASSSAASCSALCTAV